MAERARVRMSEVSGLTAWSAVRHWARTKESPVLRRNRREFLEDSMLATAAAVAAKSPAPLFAAEPLPSNSPHERLGVAVVGLRGRGGSHIGAFAGRRDTEILYLCDVDLEVGLKRTGEVAKRQGRVPRYEADLRRVLEDPRVDIVSIATPNHQHALQAIWAMQAGKDVYVEKPISHNVSEGARRGGGAPLWADLPDRPAMPVQPGHDLRDGVPGDRRLGSRTKGAGTVLPPARLYGTPR